MKKKNNTNTVVDMVGLASGQRVDAEYNQRRLDALLAYQAKCHDKLRYHADRYRLTGSSRGCDHAQAHHTWGDKLRSVDGYIIRGEQQGRWGLPAGQLNNRISHN